MDPISRAFLRHISGDAPAAPDLSTMLLFRGLLLVIFMQATSAQGELFSLCNYKRLNYVASNFIGGLCCQAGCD